VEDRVDAALVDEALHVDAGDVVRDHLDAPEPVLRAGRPVEDSRRYAFADEALDQPAADEPGATDHERVA
jgi:hypothetical protein